MILSHEQLVLVAQLVTQQEQPVECFMLISTNAKTNSFGRVFEENGLILIGEEEVELLPEFFEQAERNGVIDESGQLTEEGEELSQQVIEESFRFIKSMLAYVSLQQPIV